MHMEKRSGSPQQIKNRCCNLKDIGPNIDFLQDLPKSEMIIIVIIKTMCWASSNNDAFV